MFEVRMGIPEVRDLWEDLKEKKREGNLKGDEEELFKKISKAIKYLRNDPRSPGLNTHNIDDLSRRFGETVWESYAGQGKHAWRLFWVYGPNRKEITIISVEPHPEDSKRGGYDRVNLSAFPDD